MKTTVKITALAAIIVLAVLGCVPEVEVTSRDYKAMSEGDTPLKNSKYDASEHIPYIVINSSAPASNVIPIDTDLVVTSAKQRELVITFPATADAVRESNTAIQAALKKFMTMFYYKAGATANDPSEILETINYTFKRREIKLNNTVEITVELGEEIKDFDAMIKIDGTQYTYSRGFKLDMNGDGIAGQAVYDDVYIQLPIKTSTQNSDMDVDPVVFRPAKGGALAEEPNKKDSNTGLNEAFTSYKHYQSWTLEFCFKKYSLNANVNLRGKNAPETADPLTVPVKRRVAELTFNGNTPEGTEAEILQAELEALAPKIKLQKFNGSSWVTIADAKYFSATDNVNGNTKPCIGVEYTPTSEELGYYRVYAPGLKNLSAAGSYFEVPQKIKCIETKDTAADSTTPTDDVYVYPATAPYYYYYHSDERTINEGTMMFISTDTLISSDHKGKNITVDLFVNPTTDELVSMDIDAFNKAFKMVYVCPDEDGDQAVLTDLISQEKKEGIGFIKIIKAEYDNNGHHHNNVVGAGVQLNHIRLTLDPGYQLSDNEVYIMLSPNFKFKNEKTYVGDPANIDWKIDGVNCWRLFPNAFCTL